MKKLLLTGFEPFGGSKVNPSIEACKQLDQQVINNVKVIVHEIPLRFKKIGQTITKLIEQEKPDYIICTGEARRSAISIERVAINIADVSKSGYNCGSKPRDQLLIKNGKAAYFSTLPIRRIVKALKKEGIPAYISNTAGTFGCNQIMYMALNYVEDRNLDVPTGFIHVPRLPIQNLQDPGSPSLPLETTARALKVAVKAITCV